MPAQQFCSHGGQGHRGGGGGARDPHEEYRGRVEFQGRVQRGKGTGQAFGRDGGGRHRRAAALQGSGAHLQFA